MQESLTEERIKTEFDFEKDSNVNLIGRLIKLKTDSKPKDISYKIDTFDNNIDLFDQTLLEENYNFSEIAMAREIESFSYGIYESQNWLGHVENVNEETFSAKLIDLTNGGTNEYATFEIRDISNDDLSLLKIGAAFYYSLGYSLDSGQVSKKAVLRFQRLVELNQSDIDNTLDKISELKETINWL